MMAILAKSGVDPELSSRHKDDDTSIYFMSQSDEKLGPGLCVVAEARSGH